MFCVKKMRTVCAVFISLAVILSGSVVANAKSGKLTGNNVNFRCSPSLKSKVIRLLKKGTSVDLVSKGSKWAKIKVGSRVGYVSSEYVSVSSGKRVMRTKKVTKKVTKAKKTKKTKKKLNVRAWISASNVNLRMSPSLKGRVIGRLGRGYKVTVYSKGSKWIKLRTKSGRVGFVSKPFVSYKAVKSVKVRRNNRGSSVASSRAAKLIAYAKKFRGVRYVYGGTSPSGFDCSGFVYYCFRNCLGITLQRSSSGMCATTKHVSRSNLKPGDLLYFARGSSVYHVALYIGGGKMIHAETHSGINIDSVSSYNSTYYKAGRVL